MAYDIGPRVGIEGEKEFKSAISGINRTLKTMGTEMRAVTSAYDRNDKSAENLTAQNEVLTKRIDAQKQKLSELKAMLDKSKSAYGENDAQTQKYQQQVNLATAALNKSELQLKNNTVALENAGDESEDAGKKAKKSGDDAGKGGDGWEKLGGVLKATAVAAGAIAVAAAGIAIKLGKEVISAFADYEQFVGGVDTLFKDSSGKLQDYAANAYKTAGMSANEYMETSTGFAASLIQSLGGDTEKAVQYADMAITDMSDNANKMGTDMSSIQNAYQGFAKQNYTMLDNLKLGYGGTKSEMERLLKDATAISGIKYDVSSYADIVDAIHVVQTEMEITGTTAKEAEETISGSFSAMGSAAENWVIGLGRADADMKLLTNNVVDAFKTVLTNVVPIIENIASALPEAFEALLPVIAELLPMLLDTAVKLFRQVLETVLKLLPELIPVAVDALLMIVDTLIENLPLIIKSALEIIMALADGLLEALPELIPAIVDTVITIVDTLIDNIDMLIDASIAIIIALAEGLITALPRLIKKAPEIITKLVDAVIRNAPKLLKAAIEIIITLVKGITENLGQLGEVAADMVMTVVNGAKELAVKLWDVGVDAAKGLWEGIKSMGTWLWDQVTGFFGGIVDGVKDLLGIKSPSRVFAGIGENMAAGLGDGFGKEMKSVAKQINKAVPTDIQFTSGKIGQKQSGGINQTVNVYSPTPLTPSQIARESKNALRRLSWA